jgi:LysM repeat protein
MEDIEKVRKELLDLAKLLKSTPGPGPVVSHQRSEKPPTPSDNPGGEKPARDDKGYPYTIQSGDTLSLIVQAYRDKNIKVSVDSILKANPGLKAESLRPGKKIWIPAPQS